MDRDTTFNGAVIRLSTLSSKEMVEFVDYGMISLTNRKKKPIDVECLTW